ncbi:MAG: patatin-like phospholipase family protein [Myxococcales bacterium]|nr:patatin-like phospholipase family protein [Myxococcales bacterium]USN51715.1 MAG: patatin-like phospholipase family protein [Myxococcales bacterium]
MRAFFNIFFCCAIIFGSNSWAERPIRVLSLDGGGIRGILEVMSLTEIEDEIGKPINQIFDVMVGSSTGGLIALALSIGDEQGKAFYSARSLLEFYTKMGREVFHSTVSHKLSTGFGLWGPKYQSAVLKEHLERVLGDTMMSQALVPVIITGYHVDGETGVEFSSADAKEFPFDKDCLMREVAQATSAAPVYFDLANVEFSWGTLHGVADGGLYRNNPALIAYVNAHRMFPGRDIEVYSFGTGKIGAEELQRELNGRGLINWVGPILKHFQIGDIEADNTMLHKLINEDGKQNFFRVDIDVHRDFRAMDNVKRKNIEYLVRRGNELTKTPLFQNMLMHLKQSIDEPMK